MPELPDRPDLRHLRDEAKARARSGEFPSLSAAQLALAREHGFASWPRLKVFVESRALDRASRASALVRSACSDDPRPARTLLQAEPGLASYDLATACVTGDAATVERLLAADPAAVDLRIAPLDRTPLLYACFSRLLRTPAAAGIVAVAGVLLEAGADPNASFLEHDSVQVPVYGAAGIANNAALTGLLLSYGGDADETLTDPEAIGEALYHAVEFADLECARLLLEAGTATRKVSYCLGRALDFAREPMVLLLLEHGAVPTSAQLRKAISTGRPLSTVRALLDAGAPVARASVRLAARFERPDVVDLLVACGGDAAAAQGESPDADVLHEAVHLGDADRVQRLLDLGIDPNARTDRHPQPALSSACWRGYVDVVRALVGGGAALAWPDGSPIGAAMHGSQHCHDPQGGPMSLPVDEVQHGDYGGVVRYLMSVGATVPKDYGDGTTEAAGILADLGIEATG